jgi:hypothetical protein
MTRGLVIGESLIDIVESGEIGGGERREGEAGRSGCSSGLSVQT